MRKLKILIIFTFLLLLGTSYFILKWQTKDDVIIVVEKDASGYAVANSLFKTRVISCHLCAKYAIAIITKLSDYKIIAGEYFIRKDSNLQDVLKAIFSGNSIKRKILIKEGCNNTEIIQELEGANGLLGAIGHLPEEGFLMPDTYFYHYGNSKDEILQRMHSTMLDFLQTAWQSRNKDNDDVLKSPKDAIILASIIEKETSIEGEMPLVASVYINRLKIGMRLQADPTVLYALLKENPEFKQEHLAKHMRFDSPYNTYIYKGLPEGAIANPGRAAIISALQPSTTDYLYFVANKKGGHFFAKSYKEHRKNINHIKNLINK